MDDLVSSDYMNSHQFATTSNYSDLEGQLMENTKCLHKKNDRLNIPERIIFVIDTYRESSNSEFKLSNGQNYRTLYILKRSIEIFLHNKLMLNPKHEFALVILDREKVEWICGFTGSIKTLVNKLESIEECTTSKDQFFFDLQQVFQLIYQKELFEKFSLVDNVVRVILLYGRSNIIPRFNIADLNMQELIRNANFFLDILYVHEIPSRENKCEEIYFELSKLDIKSISYIMEVSRNIAKVHNCMARLLAHPTQRVSQESIKYSIHPTILSMTDE